MVDVEVKRMEKLFVVLTLITVRRSLSLVIYPHPEDEERTLTSFLRLLYFRMIAPVTMNDGDIHGQELVVICPKNGIKVQIEWFGSWREKGGKRKKETDAGKNGNHKTISLPFSVLPSAVI